MIRNRYGQERFSYMFRLSVFVLKKKENILGKICKVFVYKIGYKIIRFWSIYSVKIFILIGRIQKIF